MGEALEDTMSWEELCNYTILKLGNSLPSSEHSKFRKWFMEREGIGYRFDKLMILRAYKICKELEMGLDHFCVIEGREGTGKSTLAFQLLCWVVPSFTLDNVVSNARDFIEVMDVKNEKIIASGKFETTESDGILLDEGNELLSRESQKNTNAMLNKTFNVQRALNFLVVVCCPNFFFLDKNLRNHRCKTLITISNRGDYRACNEKGIKIVCEIAKNTKNSLGVRLPDGSFWHGNYRKEFPKTINKDDYLKVKHDGIKKLLNSLRDGCGADDAQYVKLHKACKVLGVDSETMVRYIKTGAIKGQQIGARWYIATSDFEKLVKGGGVPLPTPNRV